MKTRLVGRQTLLEDLVRRVRVPGGVLLRGEAGVGKSRLVDEVLAELRAAAWSVYRFVGTSGARDIPFGALFSVLPPGGATDPAQLLADVGQRLIDEAKGRRLLLAIDDVTWIDDRSLLLVADLVRRAGAVVLLTARSEDRIPEAIEGLLTEGLVEQRLVEPLDLIEATAFLEELVGARSHPGLAADVHERSRGNPLLLHELVLDALEGGSLTVADGRIVVAAPLEPGFRVQQTVLTRMLRLPALAQDVLGWACAAGSLDLSILERDERDALGCLEQHGFVGVDGLGGQLIARPSHPLIADAIVDTMPTHRRVETLTLLAHRIADADDPNPGDALRAAEWLRSIDVTPPLSLAERALAEGMRCLALDLADWIAHRALDVGDRPEILLHLADIDRLRARVEDALALLDRAQPTLTTDSLRARAAEIRAKILSHHHGRPDEAAELLEAVARELEDPALRRRLEVMAKGLGGHLGSFDDVLETTGRRLRQQGRHPVEAFWDRYFHVFAGAMTGRTAGIDAVIDEALALAPSLDDASDDVVDVLWAMRAFTHAQRGTLRSGAAEIEARIDACEQARTTNICTSTFLLPVLWHRGDLAAVRHHAGRVLDGHAGPDSWGIAPIATSMALRGCALSGDDEGARRLLATLPDCVEDERSAPFVAIGQLTVLRSEGRLEEAAMAAREAVRRATDTTHGSLAVWVLRASLDAHDPGGAAACLDAAPTDLDGSLLVAMLRHARAIASQDVDAFEDVVARYEELGALLDAAEAALHAAVIAGSGATEARRWSARGALLSSRIDGARFPDPGITDGLSAKELEIASFALAGRSNREIADMLVVSKRTVDNHLYRCYRKLDVGSRAELTDVLAPTEHLRRLRSSASADLSR